MSKDPQDKSAEANSDVDIDVTVPESTADGFDEDEETSGILIDESSTVLTDTDKDSRSYVLLMEEISELKEQLLRAQADMQNIRRRAEQDVEKARKFSLERFVTDLLPVADNLERAIAANIIDEESQKAVLEGIVLTLKSLQDALKKYQVEVVNPEGQPFDPEFHQAMTMTPDSNVEPNTVLNVFQKGYTLNGRLVRPAMVVVSTTLQDD